jgi:DnaJ-class molecular chaperone
MSYEDRLSYTRGYFHTTESQAFKDFCAEEGLRLHYRNELCHSCDGEGSRALHGLVVSQEAMEDQDFMEDYFGGKYDTKCEDCNGEKVVRVANTDAMTEEQQKAWRRYLRDVRSANAESLAELRMGC